MPALLTHTLTMHVAEEVRCHTLFHSHTTIFFTTLSRVHTQLVIGDRCLKDPSCLVLDVLASKNSAPEDKNAPRADDNEHKTVVL